MVKLGIICSGICQCRFQWKLVQVFMDVSSTMVNIKYNKVGMVEIVNSFLPLSKDPSIVIEAVAERISILNPIDEVCECKTLPLVFNLAEVASILILNWKK